MKKLFLYIIFIFFIKVSFSQELILDSIIKECFIVSEIESDVGNRLIYFENNISGIEIKDSLYKIILFSSYENLIGKLKANRKKDYLIYKISLSSIKNNHLNFDVMLAKVNYKTFNNKIKLFHFNQKYHYHYYYDNKWKYGGSR